MHDVTIKTIAVEQGNLLVPVESALRRQPLTKRWPPISPTGGAGQKGGILAPSRIGSPRTARRAVSYPTHMLPSKGLIPLLNASVSAPFATLLGLGRAPTVVAPGSSGIRRTSGSGRATSGRR